MCWGYHLRWPLLKKSLQEGGKGWNQAVLLIFAGCACSFAICLRIFGKMSHILMENLMLSLNAKILYLTYTLQIPCLCQILLQIMFPSDESVKAVALLHQNNGFRWCCTGLNTVSHWLFFLFYREKLFAMWFSINVLIQPQTRLKHVKKNSCYYATIVEIGHFTAVSLVTWPCVQARLEVTLLWYRPLSFSQVNAN